MLQWACLCLGTEICIAVVHMVYFLKINYIVLLQLVIA